MTGTRWLDEHEQVAWRAFLDASRGLFDQLDHELQHDTGMPHGYYEILVRLSEAPKHTLRMSELAARTLSSRSRLSHAVARLQEQGWVERRACATDRRGAEAQLTKAGFAALTAAAPVHVTGVRRHLFDRLDGRDVAALRRISMKVLDGLRQQKPPS